MQTDWHKRPLNWIEGNTAYFSIVFTWDLPTVRQQCLNRDININKIVVGGPAVQLMPEYLSDICEIGADMPGMIRRHNPQATRTSVGCPKKCKFCGVKKIASEFIEYNDWKITPLICDDNILACSKKHFEDVVHSLRDTIDIDLQGMDFDFLQDYHIDGLKKLNLKCLRFAWDNIKDESKVIDGINRLVKAGLLKSKLRFYVLIGYNDTPETALYRLVTLRKLGIITNPMRFQPLDTLVKNSYVYPGWTNDELIRYMRYWSHSILSKVPFKEFKNSYRQTDANPRLEL